MNLPVLAPPSTVQEKFLEKMVRWALLLSSIRSLFKPPTRSVLFEQPFIPTISANGPTPDPSRRGRGIWRLYLPAEGMAFLRPDLW
jgi:hypothetical protein